MVPRREDSRRDSSGPSDRVCAVPCEVSRPATESKNLADAVASLLSSEMERENQRAAARVALSMLRDGDTAPSDRAAGVILELIENAELCGKLTTEKGSGR